MMTEKNSSGLASFGNINNKIVKSEMPINFESKSIKSMLSTKADL